MGFVSRLFGFVRSLGFLFVVFVCLFVFLRRAAEELGAVKRQRDACEQTLGRVSLELDACRRAEAALKNQARLSADLIDDQRQQTHRRLGERPTNNNKNNSNK